MTTVTRTAGAAGSIALTTVNSGGQLITPVSTPTVTWYTDVGRTLGALALTIIGSGSSYTASWTGGQAPASQATRYLKVSIETATGVFSLDVNDDISFLAAGAIIGSTDYTTLVAVKADLGITDTNDDDAITSSIHAASRYIDQLTGTTFYPITETRRFAAGGLENTVLVDRFTTITGLVVKTGSAGTYGTTVAATSYIAAPYNAPSLGQAYDRIMFPSGNVSLDQAWPAIEVTATWGFETVPDQVERACRLIAAQLFRRKDTPDGTGGTSEYGIVRVDAPDANAMQLLSTFIDLGVA